MPEKILTIACNLLVFTLAFLMLRLPYKFSLTLVALVIVALLYIERSGAINAVFSLYIRNKKLAALSAIIFMLAIPVLLARFRYQSHIAVMSVIYAMVCLGVNFQMGSANMVNFAPAAFMGIGAYSMGVVTVKLGVSPWFGLLASIILCAAAGLLIGLPTLRTKGYYLSLVTMALQLAFTQLIKNIPYIGGPNGLSGVKALNIGGFSLYKSYTFFGAKLAPHFFYLIFCLLTLTVLYYVAVRVSISRYGLALNNIAQDEIAANCLGVNVSRYKLFAFLIGAVFCGIGGALYASLTSFVGPNDFTFARSLIFICMVILGGMDNPAGVLVGAFLLTVITEKLRDFSDYAQLIYALLLVIILVVRPSGLIPKRVRNYCALFGRELLPSPQQQDAENKSS
ncbi:MAG: branched-chain amino acid ABC transporter permease [Synergistaceae bacterium]|jgi:branched-chain amino acid transport system permease protein|nr:branched-chain amino acid ABC transporter permease [Synergistaceae bacterium]